MATQSQGKVQSQLITEFLEIAFNSILYSRKIYPSIIFVQKKKYGVPVRIATHPEVIKYISECLKTFQQLDEWNAVRHVALVILVDSKPIERHVFEVLPSTKERDPYYVHMEEDFRAYLLKLYVPGVTPPSLPDDCTFSIEIATSSIASVQLNEFPAQAHFPWVEVEEELVVPEVNKALVPLKTVHMAPFALQMYIECIGCG